MKHQTWGPSLRFAKFSYLLPTCSKQYPVVTAWAAGAVLGRRPIPKQRVHFGAAFWRSWRFWLGIKRQKLPTRPRFWPHNEVLPSLSEFPIFLRTLAFSSALRMARLLGMPGRMERRIPKKRQLHTPHLSSIWWIAKPLTYRILMQSHSLFWILFVKHWRLCYILS